MLFGEGALGLLLDLPVLALLRAHELHFEGFDGLLQHLSALFERLEVVASEVKVLRVLPREAHREEDFIWGAWQRENCRSDLGNGSSNRSELGLSRVLRDVAGKLADELDGGQGLPLICLVCGICGEEATDAGLDPRDSFLEL